MHTLGSTSLARKRHMMQQNDPNKQYSSQADLYMESRKRVTGRAYKTQNEEATTNIEKMKSLKSLDDGGTTSDPYDKVVTKKEHNGRLRLHGIGVTSSSLKSKGVRAPFVLPPEFLVGLRQEFDKKIEQTMTFVLSMIREANPGLDIVIPDFPTNQEDASSSHSMSGQE